MKAKKKSASIKRNSYFFKLFRWIFFLTLLLLLYETVIKYVEPKMFPVRHIILNGSGKHIKMSAIKHQIGHHVKGFFSTNMVKLKEDVLRVPLVEEVVVKRIWPDTLQILINEQQLVALWGEIKGWAVSRKGKVVQVQEYDNKHLPKFIGPEGQETNMLAQYMEITKMLQPLHLSIVAMNLNSRHSWVITLDNGMKIILGRKDISQRLLALTTIWPKLTKRHGDLISAIDLRHPNGVSVHLGTSMK